MRRICLIDEANLNGISRHFPAPQFSGHFSSSICCSTNGWQSFWLCNLRTPSLGGREEGTRTSTAVNGSPIPAIHKIEYCIIFFCLKLETRHLTPFDWKFLSIGTLRANYLLRGKTYPSTAHTAFDLCSFTPCTDQSFNSETAEDLVPTLGKFIDG